jgi:hypothetical protein
MILTWSSVFIHKTNDISWIFNHWTWMKFNGGNETKNELYFVEYEYKSIIFLQWTYFTLESHEISSQELWLNVWRVMTEGLFVHQPEFMNDIAGVLIPGIYINYMDKWNFECIFVNEIKHEVIFHGRKYFIFKQNEISSTMNFIWLDKFVSIKKLTSLPLDMMHTCNLSNQWG